MFARSKTAVVIALRNIHLLVCPGDVAKLAISLATVAMPGSAQVPVEGVPETRSEGTKGNAHDNDRPSTDFSVDGKTLLSEDEEVSAGAPATDFGSLSAPRKTGSRKSVKKKNAFDALGRRLSPAHLSGMSLNPLHEASQSGCSVLPREDRLPLRHTGRRNVFAAVSGSCYHPYLFLTVLPAPDPPCGGLFFSISSSEYGCHYQSVLRAVG